MTESWMIDELAFAGPEHLDPAFVAGYDEKQGHPDPAPDIAIFESLGLGPEARVIDLAAGSGQFAMAAGEHFGEVIAVDPSPAMLEVLRSRADAAHFQRDGQERVRVVAGGFMSYEHEGGLADGCYTRNALHQLPDFWKALALTRIAAMLRPGGVLRVRDLIYDFQPEEAPEVFAAWFERAATDPSKGYTKEDFAEHIRTESSTFRWLFEPMLEAAGFEIVDAEFAARLYGAYTCVRA